jgi:hypothetical protein
MRWPTFGLRTLFEATFVCGVLFYIWFNREPDNVIKPDHALQIHFGFMYAIIPRDGLYFVDPGGFVSLGGHFGKIHVAGQTATEVEAVLRERLMFGNGEVTVSIAGWKDSWELHRIQELEEKIERVTQEKESAERKLKGLYDPQGDAPAVRER